MGELWLAESTEGQNASILVNLAGKEHFRDGARQISRPPSATVHAVMESMRTKGGGDQNDEDDTYW
jgi:hypothetical protein